MGAREDGLGITICFSSGLEKSRRESGAACLASPVFERYHEVPVIDVGQALRDWKSGVVLSRL